MDAYKYNPNEAKGKTFWTNEILSNITFPLDPERFEKIVEQIRSDAYNQAIQDAELQVQRVSNEKTWGISDHDHRYRDAILALTKPKK